MQTTFKAGDKVYYPLMSNKILTLQNDSADKRYPVIITDGFHETFTSNGKFDYIHERQVIFHATPENHAALEAFYKAKFEKPKPKPTPRQVIEDRLARASFAPCLVGDRCDWDAMALIVCVKDDKDGGTQYIDGVGNVWHDAQLIDDDGCEIWELEE